MSHLTKVQVLVQVPHLISQYWVMPLLISIPFTVRTSRLAHNAELPSDVIHLINSTILHDLLSKFF